MADYHEHLIELYDDDNPDGPDHDFYRAIADAFGATSIVDVGCGTGLLTRSLATAGRSVTGVDPSSGMLAYASNQQGAQAVTWVLGDSSALAPNSTDLVVMTGNVAQHIIGDAWNQTLTHVFDALHPAGRLAFECRNPDVEAWTKWTKDATFESCETRLGRAARWTEVTATENCLVALENHTVFEATGVEVCETLKLAFRDSNQVKQDLATAGFAEINVFGDWNHCPLTSHSRVMVFVARRD